MSQQEGLPSPACKSRARKLQSANHVSYDLRRLSRADLPLDTAELAQYLIGKTIVRNIGRSRIVCRIVETEAYPPGDASGHAYRGQTASNRSLFLGSGFAHVYFTYGMHYMLNVAAEEPGVGAGVLFRALEPLEGIKLMEGAAGPTSWLTWREGRDGLRLHCKLTAGWMGLTSAPTGHCGWALPIGRLGTSAQVAASASLARSTDCCGSSKWEIPSLAARSLSR
jgi:DNA-3-methyladenine glycosylase